MDLDKINIVCFKCKVPLQTIHEIQDAEMEKGHNLVIVCRKCHIQFGEMVDDGLNCFCVYHTKLRSEKFII